MRLAALLGRAFAGVLLATPLACLHVASSVESSRSELAVAGMILECPTGAAGCPCTTGGGCDPGLECVSGICSYAGGNYEFEQDLVFESSARDRPSKRGAKARPERFDKSMAPAPAAAEASGMAAPQPAPTIDAAAPVHDPASERRQVIYTASLAISVYERDAAIEFAEGLPERWGGWIESRYDYTITLRLPAERLFEAIDQLSELGLVLDKSLRADDVSAEYVDLESRIRMLEQIVAHLELLLAKAETVEQALEIRVELDRIRLELEAARARMRQLSEMIDFSTLTLHFSQRGPDYATPSSNDPFPWVDELGLEVTEYR